MGKTLESVQITMNLAAVASNSSILPVLEAAQALPDCNVLSLWSEDDVLTRKMHMVSPGSDRCHSWDEILETQSVDTVVISGVSESVLSAAKQIVQAGLKLIVVISPREDAIRIFDLTALWQDANDRVIPLFVSGVQEVAHALKEQFDEESCGQLWKIEFERRIAVRDDGNSVPVSLAQQWFLQDCSWLRSLDDHASHVTMNTTGPNPAEPLEVSIRLSGEEALDSNWKIRRDVSSGWTLALIGEKDRIEIEGASDRTRVNISSPFEFTLPEGDDLIVMDAMSQLEKINAGQAEWQWADLIRLGEIGATAARSLTKRRTLPVHFEEASERSQFKSQMAAIGCGVLLWTMFGVIGLLTAGAIADPRDREYLISSSADSVVRLEEFVDDQTELTVLGVEHVEAIARKWTTTAPVIIIEVREGEVESELNSARLAEVLTILRSAKIRTPEKFVVLRPIHGQWFETVMFIGWLVVFLPLGIVLLCQLLILASRPTE